jgi:hypothetical protein
MTRQRMTMQQLFRATLTAGVVATALVTAAPNVQAASATTAPGTLQVELVNSATGLHADVWAGSSADYQPLVLWRNNTSTSQEFTFLPAGGADGYAYYKIQARNSGKCLIPDISRPDNALNGTSVVQLPCGLNLRSLQWRILAIATPPPNATLPLRKFVIANRFSNRCLEVRNPSVANPVEGQNLQVWDCISNTGYWNSMNQIWNIYDRKFKENFTSVVRGVPDHSIPWNDEESVAVED